MRISINNRCAYSHTLSYSAGYRGGTAPNIHGKDTITVRTTCIRMAACVMYNGIRIKSRTAQRESITLMFPGWPVELLRALKCCKTGLRESEPRVPFMAEVLQPRCVKYLYHRSLSRSYRFRAGIAAEFGRLPRRQACRSGLPYPAAG